MFSKRLTSLRKEKGKTQEDISKIIGVSRPAYTAYEKGNRTPDYEILKILADYFSITIDYLLGHTDNPDKEVNQEQYEKTAIINKIARDFPNADLMFHDMANMDAEQLQEVYEFIKFKMSQNKGD